MSKIEFLERKMFVILLSDCDAAFCNLMSSWGIFYLLKLIYNIIVILGFFYVIGIKASLTVSTPIMITVSFQTVPFLSNVNS